MSSALSRHTWRKMSLSSNNVDSQSFASEKGVILILSNFISWSKVAADGVGEEALESVGEVLWAELEPELGEDFEGVVPVPFGILEYV